MTKEGCRMYIPYQYRPRRKGISPIMSTIIMTSITVVLAAVLTVPYDFQTGTMGPCGGSYPPPKNSTIIFRSGTSGNDSVLTVSYVNGANGEYFYLDDAVVQIICGNSHNVVVQFPSSGTGLGVGDVTHFEFHAVHNETWLRVGDYFIVHICDNVHNGDIFRILDGNVTSGEVRML
jgi:flagellin-like protein